MRRLLVLAAGGMVLAGAHLALGQAFDGPEGPPRGFEGFNLPKAPPPPPGGGMGGPPGGMPGMRAPLMLVKEFDKDGNGWLNKEERAPAREKAKTSRPAGRGGPRGPFGRGGEAAPAQPGEKVSPANVKTYADKPLYDPGVLRTLFIEFENADWEAELADFKDTDVDVPAKLTVDGKTYPNVGVRFRGMSSYMMVPAGRKRSFNLSIDLADGKQKLYGHKTLNLLNSNGDPTMLRGLLYLQIARQYIPAAKANLVKVVINGESWGIYPSIQQFNKEFTQEWFDTTKGERWKVPGSPRGGGGLAYLGDDIAAYKGRYEIKTKDDEKAWKELVNLCRVLNQTPIEKLPEAIEPILDVEGVLRFLALDNTLINEDGYWIRDSDYNIYRDPKGKFHVIPHDANETFMTAGGGPGMGRGQQIKGVELDPLIGLDDTRKPLRSRLLQVPAYRERYLAIVREITEQWLTWDKLGPVVKQYAGLIEKEVEKDTRKLSTFAAFQSGVGSAAPANEEPGGFGPRRPQLALKDFVDQRRAYLMNLPSLKKPVASR